ncbi:hypothetical protein D3C76_1551520 [compost metagenome]
MSVLFNDRILFREAVHHAIILNIRTVFYDDATKITAQAGVWPDVHPFAEDHVANQHCRRMYVAFIGNDWRQSIYLIYRHSSSVM